jgi:hypothetical protein
MTPLTLEMENVGWHYYMFPIVSENLEIVVASAMFVTQVIVLKGENMYTMGDCRRFAGSQADGVDVLHEVLGAAYKLKNYLMVRFHNGQRG